MQQEITIAHEWLEAMSNSVSERDLSQHMALVSQKVMVYGVPGTEAIDYEGWLQRRRSEFRGGQLLGLSYDKPRIKTIALRRIAFNVNESMVGTANRAFAINKDVVLEKEDDGEWRVVEEVIKSIRKVDRAALSAEA